jgi:enterochelin esterase-like enzyme
VRSATFQPDPLNHHPFSWKHPPQSAVVLADAPPQTWGAPRPGIPAGTVQRQVLHSALLDNDRPVWVYTPPDYAPDNGPYPLLLQFDGRAYVEGISTPTILDNLIAAAALPPLVALFVGAIDGPTRTRELSCHPPFIDFLTGELLPSARASYHLTTDPKRAIVAGSSLGGLAAAHAGLRRPEVFGKVLAQSGSFYWKPAGEAEFEWLPRQFVAHPPLPLRFYLTAGLLEHDPRGANGPSLTLSNRHFRDILEARGYAVDYLEFNGGHDALCWERALPAGLIALLAGG